MRTHHHADFRIERAPASAVLPAKDCAPTVGRAVAAAAPAVEEVVVVAADEPTAQAAEESGARVLRESELGDVRGKGDAMRRALPELRHDLVVFLDADLPDPPPHYAPALLGPLLAGEADFVKAFYRRPLGDDPDGGGRVNHLMARPALRVFFPELAVVRQPLAGEVAARRDLLQGLDFEPGYGVEIGMLIDVWRAVGIERMAQVDLGDMVHVHQPLHALTDMAETVLRTIVAHR